MKSSGFFSSNISQRPITVPCLSSQFTIFQNYSGLRTTRRICELFPCVESIFSILLFFINAILHLMSSVDLYSTDSDFKSLPNQLYTCQLPTVLLKTHTYILFSGGRENKIIVCVPSAYHTLTLWTSKWSLYDSQ